jgi:hypothetical protein
METIRPLPQYVEKASTLATEEQESLLAKSQWRFANTNGFFLLQPIEKVALQLHFEEQALEAWQTKVLAMRAAADSYGQAL